VTHGTAAISRGVVQAAPTREREMFARMTGAVAAAAMMLAGVAAAGETAEPGYVRGTVRTAAGAPIPGALIFIDGVLDQNFQFTTKEDGAFNIRLQPGAYVAQATLSYKWEGQTYKFDLRPDSTDTFDDSTGAVRNFTWRSPARSRSRRWAPMAALSMSISAPTISIWKIRTTSPGRLSLWAR